MSSDRLSERGLIIVTAIVWIAIAVSSIALVLKAGSSSAGYILTLYMIAVLVWAAVLLFRQKRKGISDIELEKRSVELSNKIVRHQY